MYICRSTFLCVLFQHLLFAIIFCLNWKKYEARFYLLTLAPPLALVFIRTRLHTYTQKILSDFLAHEKGRESFPCFFSFTPPTPSFYLFFSLTFHFHLLSSRSSVSTKCFHNNRKTNTQRDFCLYIPSISGVRCLVA